MLYKEEYDGVFNPYNFQIEHYEQLPEDIAIEILSFADSVDISEIPIKVINDWLQQEAEVWNWTDGASYE